jgi:mRNA-degrading endonuclease RelE of RelBE toxin-antitoxin system
MRPEVAPYQLELRRSVQKQLNHLSDEDANRIAESLERMAELGIGDVKDIGDDYTGRYRLRVGDWRVYFNLDGSIIDVILLEKRGEAYKKRSRNKRKK